MFEVLLISAFLFLFTGMILLFVWLRAKDQELFFTTLRHFRRGFMEVLEECKFPDGEVPSNDEEERDDNEFQID